jgi:5-methylcytosine-specific restriction endonuclease McrA
MAEHAWGLNWKPWVQGKFRCVYCDFDGTTGLLAAHQLTVDHIRPKCKGGTDEPNNLAAACCACNGIKADWDRRIYEPAAFAGKPSVDVLKAARDFVQDWYRKWDPDYETMLRQVT